MFTPQPYPNYAGTPARRTDQGAAGQVPATGARQQNAGSSFHFPPPSGAQATSPGFGPPATTPAQMPFSLAASGMDSIRDRPPAQNSLLSPTVPQQPFFSPLSAKPAREEPPLPAASQADELPPLQSMLDLNAGADAQAAAAGAQQAAGAANVGGGGGGGLALPSISTDGPYWVTAFGYHTAAMIAQVLQELRPSNGEIAQHQPGAGAWLHVRFQEWRQMQEALAKNGRVRVASANLSEQPERHHAPPMTLPSRRATPLQVVQGFMLGVIEGVVPSSSALSLPSVPPMITSIPLRLQHTRGAEYHVGSARIGDPAGKRAGAARENVVSSVFNKTCEYVFGW